MLEDEEDWEFWPGRTGRGGWDSWRPGRGTAKSCMEHEYPIGPVLKMEVAFEEMEVLRRGLLKDTDFGADPLPDN